MHMCYACLLLTSTDISIVKTHGTLQATFWSIIYLNCSTTKQKSTWTTNNQSRMEQIPIKEQWWIANDNSWLIGNVKFLYLHCFQFLFLKIIGSRTKKIITFEKMNILWAQCVLYKRIEFLLLPLKQSLSCRPTGNRHSYASAAFL